MMDQDYYENTPAEEASTPPAGQKPALYDFEVPQHLTISDMLTIQLADCVRIVRRLSDQASDPHLHDTERLHTIHSLENVVNASETLTRTIGRFQSDAWDHPPKRGHAKR